MSNRQIYSIFLVGILFLSQNSCSPNVKKELNNDLTWTYTYVKAKESYKNELKATIIKNWFVMDSIAQLQGLIKDYELIENIGKSESTDWDFIVAVEYFTKGNYVDIAEEFEKIRQAHKTVKINGLTFNEVGQVVKSELVKKNE